MFGLGFGHLLLLAAIGLIVLGPEQMTELAKVLGRTVAELKKAMREVTSTISLDPDNDEERRRSGYMKEASPPPLSTADHPPLPGGVAPPLPPVPQNTVVTPAVDHVAENILAAPLVSPALGEQMQSLKNTMPKFELKPEFELAPETPKSDAATAAAKNNSSSDSNKKEQS